MEVPDFEPILITQDMVSDWEERLRLMQIDAAALNRRVAFLKEKIAAAKYLLEYAQRTGRLQADPANTSTAPGSAG